MLVLFVLVIVATTGCAIISKTIPPEIQESYEIEVDVKDDEHLAQFYQMEGNMTVFGFGRESDSCSSSIHVCARRQPVAFRNCQLR